MQQEPEKNIATTTPSPRQLLHQNIKKIKVETSEMTSEY